MTTTFTSSNLNIDIEKLKREIEISGTFIVNAIVPGVPLVTDTEVILDGTIDEPEYSAIQLIIDNHTNNKDSSSLSVTSNVKVQKNLQVDGTQTTFNTEEVTIEDHLIQINSNVVPPADPEEVFSGFEVMRGTQDSALFGYDERIGETPGFKAGLGLAGLSLVVTEATLSSIEISRSQLVAGTGSRVLFNDATTGRVTESEDFQWLVFGANRSLLLQQSGVPFLFLTTGPTPHSYLTINSFAVNSEEFLVKDLRGSDTLFRVSPVGLNSVVTSTVDKFLINGQHGGLPRLEINRTLLADDVTIRTDNFSLLNSAGNTRLTFSELSALITVASGINFRVNNLTASQLVSTNATKDLISSGFGVDDVCRLSTDQTITGQKTFSHANGIVLGSATNKATIQYSTNVARTYTIPDVGANANFVMTQGNQTISGTKTFLSTIAGNISGNAFTATTATLASSVTDGVYTIGSQTIGGIKTFTLGLIASSLTSETGDDLQLTGNGVLIYSSGIDIELQGFNSAAIMFSTDTGSSVNNRWSIRPNGNFRPELNGAYDIGADSRRVSTVFTNLVSPFTGSHIYLISNLENLELGDSVYIENKQLKKCGFEKDKKCIGIIAKIVNIIEGMEFLDSFEIRHEYDPTLDKKYAMVAALGDGRTGELDGAKLCDEGGQIEDGDLLCTSNKPGFLKKQDDDLVHAYTVGQAKETVVFDENGEATGCYIYLFK